mmetsp:Transcript_8292/g.13867  ORF Transcript_8292/g.13867 Transcript_8292/m.13867 type:complete len:152 (+) Transcript_8292:23-478(+)
MDEPKDDEMQPMMEAENKSVRTKNSTASGRNKSFCGCFSKKCGVIFLTTIVIANFFFEVIQIILISNNFYFDPVYPMVYALLLLPMAYSIGTFIYFYMNDTPGARERAREGFIFAAIANFLIALWIIIYITQIYPYDKVYIKEYDRFSSDS